MRRTRCSAARLQDVPRTVTEAFRSAQTTTSCLADSFGKSRKSTAELKTLAEDNASLHKLLGRLLRLPDYEPGDRLWLQASENLLTDFQEAHEKLTSSLKSPWVNEEEWPYRLRRNGLPSQSALGELSRSLTAVRASEIGQNITRVRMCALHIFEDCTSLAKLNTLQGRYILLLLVEEGNYNRAGALINATRSQLLEENPVLWFLVAAYSGNVDETERLLEIKDQQAETNPYKSIALFIAIERDHRNVVQALLSSGMNVNARDDIGQTGLHRATRLRNENIVATLIEHGAAANIKDKHQQTAWSANLDPNNEHILDMLLEAGADPNTTEDLHVSRLYPAAANGDTDVVRYMLKSGTNPSIRTAFNWAPLHWAACHGQVECVKLLIEAGAEVEPVSDEGRTPLDLATANHRTAVIELLNAAGPSSRPGRSIDLVDRSFEDLDTDSDSSSSNESSESVKILTPTETSPHPEE